MSTSQADPISICLGGLRLQAVEGVALLDRMAPIRRMATATLRGIAGHGLRAGAPELADELFKPGSENHRLPAYVFQPLHGRRDVGAGFPFRIVTWDAGHRLLPALRHALEISAGCHFGETGARFAGVEWAPSMVLRLEDSMPVSDIEQVVLYTPLRLRRGEVWFNEETLALGALANAAVNRINALSTQYGNGIELGAGRYESLAGEARELYRSLRFVQPWRRSSTQERNLHLAGLVGRMTFRGMPEPVYRLLTAASLLNFGKHAAEGCGCFFLTPG